MFTSSLILMAGSCLSACESMPSPSKMTPAVLVSADESSLLAVKTAIGQLMDRKTIKFGANDYKNSSTFNVLPERMGGPPGSPHLGLDFAMPIRFDLIMDGSNCYVVKQGTDTYTAVEGVNCQAL